MIKLLVSSTRFCRFFGKYCVVDYAVWKYCLTFISFLALLPWLGFQAQYGLGLKIADILDFFCDVCVCVFIFIQCKIYNFLVFFVFSSLTHDLLRIIFLNFQIFMDYSDTLFHFFFFLFARKTTLNDSNYFKFDMAVL